MFILKSTHLGGAIWWRRQTRHGMSIGRCWSRRLWSLFFLGLNFYVATCRCCCCCRRCCCRRFLIARFLPGHFLAIALTHESSPFTIQALWLIFVALLLSPPACYTAGFCSVAKHPYSLLFVFRLWGASRCCRRPPWRFINVRTPAYVPCWAIGALLYT